MVLSFVVKLGGAAITKKTCFETVNEDVLQSCVEQLRRVYNRRGRADFIVVHGAGSFGHFQANRAGVSRGGLHNDTVRNGFVETRCSVTKLNRIVVSAMVEAGIPAVGVSLCGFWATRDRKIVTGSTEGIERLLEARMIPVLHGDAVMDEALGCTILSGDVIITQLAKQLRPSSVIFLTNVDGLFDRDPCESSATLIKDIRVTKDGKWSVGGTSTSVYFTVAAHDTTGGIKAKVQECVSIVLDGVPVYICKAGTESSLYLMEYAGKTLDSENWIGTAVKSSED